MTNARFRIFVAMSASIAIAGPVYAQSTPDAAKPAPAAASSNTAPAAAPAAATATTSATAAGTAQTPAADKPPGPSPEIIRAAREGGWRPEKNKAGATVYCKEDANTGTRFTTKKCVDEDRLVDTVAQNRALVEQLHRSMQGTSSK